MKRFPALFTGIALIFTSLLLLSCTKKEIGIEQPVLIPDTNGISAGAKSYLALGDSYTIGQSVAVAERFPVQLVSELRIAGYEVKKPEIIATTGWTTGNLLTAIKTVTPSKPYDAVSLLIGVNNQYQRRTIEEYRNEFTELLTMSIALAGNKASNVVVLSIPDYSVTPYAEQSDKQTIAGQIDAFNKVNKEISDLYKVNYINVTAESRKAAADPTLVAADGLHFSGKEYRIWAKLMLPVFKTILR